MHVEKPPSDDLLLEIKNDGVKPRGGFWTSTFDENAGSSWLEWNKSELNWLHLKKGHACYVLKVVGNPRILEIDDLIDLKALLDAFTCNELKKMKIYYLDFEKISKFYDAIHLTDNGQWKTRLTRPGLYGWDCECTSWFTLNFLEIIEMIRIKDDWIVERPDES